MDERTTRILEAAIQEYIGTGEPVSSGLLYEKYDFGIKPAMIRLELDALEEDGYLTQPHHAAGRVPTDMGYELYVKRALGVNGAGTLAANSPARALSARRALPEILEDLSRELGLLSVAADMAHDAVYKAGLEALVDNLDWEDRGVIRSVIHDFEEVDARLPRAAEKMGDGPRVFIGKNPLTKSEHLSVIGGNYRIGDAVVSIFAIGPKRMDYRKTIRILRNLS